MPTMKHGRARRQYHLLNLLMTLKDSILYLLGDLAILWPVVVPSPSQLMLRTSQELKLLIEL